jgi:hypothetical protein
VDKWLEVSLSASLPLQSSFTEVHTLYTSNKVVGENEITYRLGGVFLNARVVINVVQHVSKPRLEPTPVAPAISTPIAVGQKLRLDVYFKRNTPKLLSDSYLGLDDVVAHYKRSLC